LNKGKHHTLIWTLEKKILVIDLAIVVAYATIGLFFFRKNYV